MKFSILKPLIFGIIPGLLVNMACNRPGNSDSAEMERKKPIKQNSPLDESRKVKSREMMSKLSEELGKIPGTIHFQNIVRHAWNNHLFVNAESQGYLVICVSDEGINKVVEEDRNRLQDTSSFNNGYQLKFLIHHIVSIPKNINRAIIYRSLAGEDLYIDDNRNNLRHKNKIHPIKSSIKYSENMEIVLIDSPLFF